MADPTFRAASSIVLVPSSGSATSVDVDKPTGTVDGDYIFIVIVTNATTNAANSAPSGFGSAILTVANGLYNIGFRVFGKVAASEPSTYTLTETSANANGSAFAISYSNPGGTPINASDVTSFQNGTTAPSFPTLTTSATGKLIGFVIEHLGSTITISATGSMTSRVSQASSRSFMWAEEDISTTGSISGRTASGSTSNYVTGALLLTAGGGGSSTITADQGSFALTGQATNLLFNRAITADYGAYSLTGQDVTLTKETPGAFSLTAETGTYNWNGQDALADYAMNAAAGSYSFSGQEVTFSIGVPAAYSLTADAGSYSLTGQNARLDWSGAPIVPNRQAGIYMGIRIGL